MRRIRVWAFLSLTTLLVGCAATTKSNPNDDGGGGEAASGGSGGSDPGGMGGTSAGGQGGEAPSCDAPLLACGDACINPLDDAQHCGSCGHSCLGQPCDQGECRATLLANNLINPLDMVVDGDDAFVSNLGLAGLGGLDRIAVDGSAQDVVVHGTNWGGWAADQDAQYVYMSDNGAGVTSIYAIDKTATDELPPTPVITMSLSTTLRGLAVTDTHVFWVEQSGGGVRRAPKGGGAVEDIYDVDSDRSGGRMIAAGGYVYWAWSTSTGGQIMRVPDDLSTAPETVVDAQPHPFGLFVDGTTLYWTNMGAPLSSGSPDPFAVLPYSGSINRVELGTANVQTIATGVHSPMSVLVHDGHVYWGTNYSQADVEGWDPLVHTAEKGAVWRSPLADVAPEFLGSGFDLVPALRVHDGALLFLSSASGGLGGGSFFKWELE